MISYDGEILEIEGIEYIREDYTGEARLLFDSLVYSLEKIRHTQNEMAIYDTSRLAYTKALKNIIQND